MSQPIRIGQRARDFVERNRDRLLAGGLSAGVTAVLITGQGAEMPASSPTPPASAPSQSAPQNPATQAPAPKPSAMGGPVTARPVSPAQTSAPRPGTQTQDGVEPQGRNYQVLAGQSQSSIAREYCTSIPELAGLNGFSSTQELREGEWIVIPHAPSHSGQVTELLRTLTETDVDSVQGLLESEFPDYTVSRQSDETFAWKLEHVEADQSISVRIQDACVSFTSGATGFGGNAELVPDAGGGLSAEALSKAVRDAFASFQDVHARAKGQG